MPVKSKINCSESEKSYPVATNLQNNDCGECNLGLDAESSTKIRRPQQEPPRSKKSGRKQSSQSSSTIQYREIEEETVEGNTAKHGYYFSLSDPYNIQKLIEKKSFSPFNTSSFTYKPSK